MYNFDLALGMSMPFLAIGLYLFFGSVPEGLFPLLVIIPVYFGLNLLAVHFDYFLHSVLVTFVLNYALLLTSGLLMEPMLVPLIGVALALNGFIFLPGRRQLSMFFFCLFFVTCLGLSAIDVLAKLKHLDDYSRLPALMATPLIIFGFLLFISLTTALLFYKNWFRKLFELKTGKGKLVLFRSLHRLVGLWSVPFVILFSVTGIWYFLERTNTANISKVSNMKSPKLAIPMMDSVTFASLSYDLDYEKAIEQAKSAIPNLRIKDILPPSKMDGTLYLNGISDVPLERNRANRIFLHPETYEVLEVQRAEESPTRMWLNDIADPLHYGYWGGLVTKILWFIGGFAISGLVLTGIWVSLKRRVRMRSAQQQKVQSMRGWKYVNWLILLALLFFMYAILITRYQASFTALFVIS